jgi:hypothetical protein
LDALEPSVLADLVRKAVMKVRDEKLWAPPSSAREDAQGAHQVRRQLPEETPTEEEVMPMDPYNAARECAEVWLT